MEVVIICSRVHRQRARFNDDVDDVVPLVVHSVCAGFEEQALLGTNSVSNSYVH